MTESKESPNHGEHIRRGYLHGDCSICSIYSVLVVVDVQNDFLPGGSLPVAGGNKIIPVINRIRRHFSDVIFTMDSHPANHRSFASNNPGKKPFEMGEIDGRPQMMWPDHCVRGTKGWELSGELDCMTYGGAAGDLDEDLDGRNPLPETHVVEKGQNPDFDSYSAFRDDGGAKTSLKSRLVIKDGYSEATDKPRMPDRLFICGLATDYCVLRTVIDAILMPHDVVVIVDACRGLAGAEAAFKDMVEAGAKVIDSKTAIVV
jgi:nicotinamidase/pyrazinamidase